MKTKIVDHLAIPGPLYWDYRCLICSKDVRDHSVLGWIHAKIFGR